MRLHNEIKVKFLDRDEEYVSYNTMIKSTLLPKLRNLDDWFGVLAFGSGTSETGQNQTALETFITAKELIVSTYNYNPTSTMFLEKRIYFDANDNTSLSFSEIGISSSLISAESEIYSRFLFKNANGEVIVINRNAGEKMEVFVKCYLEMEDSSNIMLTSGDNILAKCLLGNSGLSQNEKVFKVYSGIDSSSNDNMVDHTSLNGFSYGEVMTAGTPTGDEIFNFTANLQNFNAVEAIFSLNNQPFARINISSSSTTVVENITSTTTNTVALTHPNVTQILELYNTTDDVIYGVFTPVSFTLNFGEFISSPFETLYDSNYELIESNDGVRIAFFGDNNLDVFRSYFGRLYKCNFDCFTYRQNIRSIHIIGDYVLVRYEENAISKIDAYVEENMTFREVGFDSSRKFPTGLPIFNQFEVVKNKNGTLQFCYLLNSPGNAYVISSSINSSTRDITLGSTLGKSSTANIKKIFPCNTYSTYEALFLLYVQASSTNKYFIKTNGTSFTSKLNDQSTSNMVSKVNSAFPFGSWLGAYESEKLIWMYNNRKPTVLSYAYSHDNVSKVYGSRCGTYIADADGSAIYMSYINDHADFIAFTNSYSYSGFTIDKLIPLKDALLIKIVGSPYYKLISLPAIYTKVSLSGSAGDTVQASYKTATSLDAESASIKAELN